MKKYSPVIFLILMLAVPPSVSSGSLNDAVVHAAMIHKIKRSPVEPDSLEPRSSAVIARIFVPDL